MPQTIAVLTGEGTMTQDRTLTAALLDATVTRGLELPTTFTLRFSVDRCDDGYQHIDEDVLQPWSRRRVAVLATAGGPPPVWHCLGTGYVVEKKVTYGQGGSGTVLEIRGEDRSLLLDTEPDAPIEDRDLHNVIDSVLRQLGVDRVDNQAPRLQRPSTDNPYVCAGNMREFLTQWAGRTGARCWIETETDTTALPGETQFQVRETVRFAVVPARRVGVPITLSAPQGASRLLVGGDGCGTVRSLDVTVRGNVPTRSSRISALRADGETQDVDVDSPSTTPLGAHAAGAGPERRASLGPDDGVSPEERQMINQAAIDDASWFVEATSETTAEDLGTVLRPGELVEVHGAGHRNDGTYLVRSVEHHVDAKEHTLRLTLMSNAQGAATAAGPATGSVA